MKARHLLLITPLMLAACQDDSGGDGDDFTVEFPSDFLWGTASAAYQVEGSNDPDLGEVESNWWEWEQEPTRIVDGQRNPEGSGFYTMYDSDFALAASIGNKAYRLGIEWARIEPQPGVFNEAAIQHYRDVIQSARDHGLEPMVTLYHWVVPNWVQSPVTGLDILSEPPMAEQQEGKTVLISPWGEQIMPFVERMGRDLGDLVDTWVVLNEPYTVLLLGYLAGSHPNGDLLQVVKLRNAALNYIIAYAGAYDALVANDTEDANGDGRATIIGNAQVGTSALPNNPNSADDIAAAGRINYLVNQWMMNAWSSGDLDVTADGDHDDQGGVLPEGNYAEQLGNRLDYIGFNYYSPVRVLSCPGMATLLGGSGPEAVEIATNLSAFPSLIGEPGTPISENGLEIHAPGILDALRNYSAYADEEHPVYILENGHGDCDDNQRARYITEHLYQLGLGIKEGLPLKAYMLWSLTDNFEWMDGRHQCFGIYKVDYENNFARRPTKTVDLYKRIIAEGEIDRDLFEEYTAGRYPTDCRSIEDPVERQACIDAVPENPMATLQQVVLAACAAQ